MKKAEDRTRFAELELEETSSSEDDSDSSSGYTGSNGTEVKFEKRPVTSKRIFSRHKIMVGYPTQRCKDVCVEGKLANDQQFKVLSYNVLADSYF